MRHAAPLFHHHPPVAPSAAAPEILWDKYGVPHIFASDRESMFYAEGWAQAEAQGNLLLLLYGESRGRAAEYWGPSHLALDRWVQLNGVPERAKTWYDAQDPEFRKYMDAFARGINDYGKAHPDSIGAEYRVVLPVSGVDVVGHSLRAVHYMYMGSMERVRREVTAHLRSQQLARTILPEIPEITPGSNTWAVGPSRSSSGKSMLLINPHLAWGDTFYRYMEVHLVCPGYDLYGAPQIGFPTPVNGFNRRTGWGRTVNTIDTVDLYRLTVKGDQYEFDGKLRPFEHAWKTLKIKQPDGSLTEEKLEILRSIQGPVVFNDKGVMISMRVAGLDRPKMLEQWFRMGEAKNLEEFKNALRMKWPSPCGMPTLCRRRRPHHGGVLRRPGPQARHRRREILGRRSARRHVQNHVDRLSFLRGTAAVPRPRVRLQPERE